jgi:Uma2 family endonuclease
VQLVWLIDPQSRSAKAFTGPGAAVDIAPDGTLDSEDILPGFQLSLAEIFEETDRQSPR